MFLACVNGGAIGLLNILVTLVVKEMYDESFLVDFYILGHCLYGLGEISGSFAAGKVYYNMDIVIWLHGYVKP